MSLIKLNFRGYWRDKKARYIPDGSGVYLVYACRRNLLKRKISVKKLIYIGESSNVRDRVLGVLMFQEGLEDWKKHLRVRERLYFAFAPASRMDRRVAAAALINFYKPSENVQYKDYFPFEKTQLVCTGKCKFINENTVVTP